MSLERDFIREVDQLPIGDQAKQVERAERLQCVIDVMAERALDIATDPDSSLRDSLTAEVLYKRLINSEIKAEEPTIYFEQDENVPRLAQRMADMYSTPERPLSASDFSVIEYKRKDNNGGDNKTSPSKALIFNNPRGLSFNYLISDDVRLEYQTDYVYGNGLKLGQLLPEEEHTVELGQKSYDTRQGMTIELYEAFISKQEELGNPLPDSVQSKGEHSRKTCTVLSDDTRYGGMRVVSVSINTKSNTHRITAFRCGNPVYRNIESDIRFRPAIDLG